MPQYVSLPQLVGGFVGLGAAARAIFYVVNERKAFGGSVPSTMSEEYQAMVREYMTKVPRVGVPGETMPLNPFKNNLTP
eukprot:CAMPEP_0114231422 /NCGR_PEP_ID=MMETSP0058-20121206/4034_1 /TAXON_ID=36894 /ORGANISM="Pyramimonas parkeae, CCMP726" /LENGTH=78 /DNA_ID=CAMNT_0001342767 /DNA_START=92 /DNA_END=328 /DNA_ORIENTATION=+